MVKSKEPQITEEKLKIESLQNDGTKIFSIRMKSETNIETVWKTIEESINQAAEETLDKRLVKRKYKPRGITQDSKSTSKKEKTGVFKI